MCGIYSKLTIKTTDFAHCSGVSIVDFEQVNANTKIIQVLFLFFLFTLNDERYSFEVYTEAEQHLNGLVVCF